MSGESLNRVMRKSLVVVFALCLLPIFVVGDIGAQGAEEKITKTPPQQGEGQTNQSKQSGSAGGGATDGAATKPVDPDNPTAGEVLVNTSRGSKFFAALASVRPRRLAPGETGVLHVVVTLRPGRVVLPDALIFLNVKRDKGPWVLGQTELKPARLAEYAKHYAGKPVYDDTIEFEVPLTVAADAKHDKYSLAGYVQLEVTNGSDGKSLGLIAGGLVGRVHIGNPLLSAGIAKKVKKVAGSTKRPDSEVSDPVTERQVSPGFEGGSDGPVNTDPSASYEGVLSEGTENSAGNSSSLDPDLSSGKSYWPMLAGLALLLVVVFLFLRGKR